MRRMMPFYLVYLIIVTLVVTGVSFSKYATIVDGQDAARVASPVLRYVPVSATFNDEPYSGEDGFSFKNVKPGDKLVYDFNITNFDGKGTADYVLNEVLLKYKIDISVEPVDVLPLTQTLTRVETGVVPVGWILLDPGQEIIHDYRLTIEWAEGAEVGDYSEKEQTVKITINAEQTQ